MGIALKHSHLTGFLTAPFTYKGETSFAFIFDGDSSEAFTFDGVSHSPIHI